jgi:tetratricopeptide (TPR) repeat protein
MSTAFQRGFVLMQQGRYDLADREFRQELASDPDNAQAHGFLALCLHEQGKHDDAIHEASEAVRLEPDDSFSHYVRGLAFFGKKQYREARASAEEAIRLEPYDPNPLSLLSNVAIARGKWSEALDAAERGLAIDPTHAACTNLRALALVQLGRKSEAAATLGSALADDPENALTHANQGWTYLHHGDHAKALEHFREALRLDPEMEWARIGIIEALKARHLFYRLMLRFFLWMGRQSRFVLVAIVLGLLFGPNILAAIANSAPEYKPFLMPVIWLAVGFVLMTWISGPLFNLLLQLNKFGRMALSVEQRIESFLVGGCFCLAASAFVANLIHWTVFAEVAMIYFGLMTLPLVVIFRVPAGRPRWLMVGATCVIALLGVPVWVWLILGNAASRLVSIDRAAELFGYFKIGAMLSTWLPTALRLRER